MNSGGVRAVWELMLVLLLGCGDDDSLPDAGSDGSFDGTLDTALDTGGSDAAAPEMRVLFVGNSYTQFNDLPSVIAQIGEASSTPLEVEVIAVGGATLYDHMTSTGARERIEAGGLDAVVLQGQSLEASVLNFTLEMFPDVLADTNNVWFATWARHGDYFADPDLGPASMNASNGRGYRDAAALAGGVVARVGGAWELARMEMPDVRLHHDDLSHPRPEGSLIAACVIHQTLTGRTPVLPRETPYGLDRDLAQQLCALASRVTCAFEHEECDGECIEVANNPESCGACGVVCEGSNPCIAGSCGCTFDGYSGCDRSYCANLDVDESNCGACGVTCTGGETCSTGTCECPTARSYDLWPLPGCPVDFTGTPEERIACSAAGHAHCEALDCFDSGYSPPSGHSPMIGSLMCLDAETRDTTVTELATHQPSCTESVSAECVTAIHRYCVSQGFASGFGPIAQSDDAVTVTCLPTGTLETATAEELGGHASRCVPHPIDCGIAAYSFCIAAGYPGGFGPVETNTIVCF